MKGDVETKAGNFTSWHWVIAHLDRLCELDLPTYGTRHHDRDT
jgi:hypothetical protein